MRYGVTGPTDITPDQAAYVADRVKCNLRPGDTLVSGCAMGVDTIAARIADADPRVTLTLTVPVGNWHNVGLIATVRDFPETRVVEVEGGYMKRNDKTVELSDCLLAFPPTAEEELRSGTWATIRRARKKGIPVKIMPLDKQYDCDYD